MHKIRSRGGNGRQWVIEADYSYANPFSFAASRRYYLTIRLSIEQARLLEALPDRGCVTFTPNYTPWRTTQDFTARGIEITEDEANQIVAGADPVAVLFAFPACGYRLRAVPAEITAGGG